MADGPNLTARLILKVGKASLIAWYDGPRTLYQVGSNFCEILVALLRPASDALKACQQGAENRARYHEKSF